MKKKILAGNWKLNKITCEVDFFLEAAEVNKFSEVRSILAPSPTLLAQMAAKAPARGYEIFSQNVSWADDGAFTGEISALQLKDHKVKGSLVGHSERREYFGESNRSCLGRLEALFRHKLAAIYCIGEKLEARQAGETRNVLKEQLAILSELKPAATDDFMIAYEPVWAIGTGQVANIEQITESHAWIAEILSDLNIAKRPPILYGGSVKPDNFSEISQCPGVDGALVGGASLRPESWLDLYKCLK